MTAPAADAPPWRRQAACARPGVDPEAFFPEKGGTSKPAKWICQVACPVRDACLQYALTNRIEDGIWGGLSSLEREKLLPKIAKSRAPKRPREATGPRKPRVMCGCGAQTCPGVVARETRVKHQRRVQAA